MKGITVLQQNFSKSKYILSLKPGHPYGFEIPGQAFCITHPTDKYTSIEFCGFPNNCGPLLMYSYYYITKFTKEELLEVFDIIKESLNVGGLITVLGQYQESSSTNHAIEEMLIKVGFEKGGSYPNPVHPGRFQAVYSKSLYNP